MGVAAFGAIALGYGLPLGREGTAAVTAAMPPTPFIIIFHAAAASVFVAFLFLIRMPEHPLKGAERASPPGIE